VIHVFSNIVLYKLSSNDAAKCEKLKLEPTLSVPNARTVQVNYFGHVTSFYFCMLVAFKNKPITSTW
jgi:hypothetical protein